MKMGARKNLFLAFSEKGWGEAILGLRIADELRRNGETCIFLCHPVTETLFSNCPHRFEIVSENLGPLLLVLIQEVVTVQGINCIILCDYLTCDHFLKKTGVNTGALCNLVDSVVAIDTWDSESTGNQVDLFVDKQRHLGKWLPEIAHLIPVPIARLQERKAIYNNLPRSISIAKSVRHNIRTSMNAKSTQRLIFFCTAEWQQTTYSDPDGDRLAAAVPILLSNYFNCIEGNIRLIHVGPESYSQYFNSSKIYSWYPPTNSERFNFLLASCDLFLTLNWSATTIAKALVSNIPTLVVQNSELVKDLSWLTNASFALESDVEEWIKSYLPIYPFRLWPLGLYRFLKNITSSNPYVDSICYVEILDKLLFIETLNQLLFDGSFRQKTLERQTQYVEKTRSLPSAAQALDIVRN